MGNTLLGNAFIVALVGFVVTVVFTSRMNRRVKLALLSGLALRIGGALSYLYIIGSYYGGGDYARYYRKGMEYATSTLAGDSGSLLNLATWMSRRWWGTEFVDRAAGLTLLLLGPTLPGAFVLFALIGCVGLVSLGLAFVRAFPGANGRYYSALLAIFPSLWFWPAALGKDALVLCGVGLATLGLTGRRGHPDWFTMALGVGLVFCVRPQVATVLAFAIVAAHWLGSARKQNVVRVLQGLVLVAAGVAVLSLSSGSLGVELFNPQDVEEYLDSRARASSLGGSALNETGGSRAPWLAPLNTLLRPFPWEAHGGPMILASAEVIILCGLAWYRRREIRAFIRECRGISLFWLAAIFVLFYATALGMSISNIGIIARQRVHILPFIFMFFAGMPRRDRRKTRPSPVARHDELNVDALS